MRNFILVSIAGLLLTGCLTPDKSTIDDAGSVAGDNQAPTISGQPSSETLFGESYWFQPNASDPDGDPLTFSVQNKPLWASFDTSTGTLQGQPLLADVGTYDSVVISVSDGVNQTALPAFSIAVTQTALGNVTLSWVAPTQNADGSALTDLAGYKVYYGKTSGMYDHQIQIDNPSISTYVVEQLSAATYYFAATAINASGIESSFSGEVIRTVP